MMPFVNSLRLTDLGRGACYALWGFRAAAVRHGDCPALMDAFRSAFGERGAHALAALHLFAHVLGRDGGRRISLAPPGCCRVTPDELSIVAALAAAQHEDLVRRDAHLAWLTCGAAEERARAAADAVGCAFRSAGLPIDAPSVEVSAPLRSRVLTIHHAAGAA
jgi:hypothetical protein